MLMPVLPDAIACFDEAGEKGLVRNALKRSKDEIALMAGLVGDRRTFMHFKDHVEEIMARLKSEDDAAKKIHYSGLDAEQKEKAKAELAPILLSGAFGICFSARWIGHYLWNEDLLEKLRNTISEPSSPTSLVFPSAKRPSNRRIETDLFKDFSSIVEAIGRTVSKKFGEDLRISFVTDTIDRRVLKELVEVLHEQSSETRRVVYRGRDLDLDKPIQRSIEFRTPEELIHIHTLSELVIGEEWQNFLSDVICSSLYRHLRDNITYPAPLNPREAIKGFWLEEFIQAAPKPGIVDKVRA